MRLFGQSLACYFTLLLNGVFVIWQASGCLKYYPQAADEKEEVFTIDTDVISYGSGTKELVVFRLSIVHLFFLLLILVPTGIGSYLKRNDVILSSLVGVMLDIIVVIVQTFISYILEDHMLFYALLGYYPIALWGIFLIFSLRTTDVSNESALSGISSLGSRATYSLPNLFP